MNSIAYVGVDPGKSGFVTVKDFGGYKFYPMPEHKIDTGKITKTGKAVMKTVFWEGGFRDLVFQIKNDFPKHKFIVGIEEVGGRGGWSATNNFNFGYVAGIIKMVFIMLKAEIIMVRPQKWQSYMRQGYQNVKKQSSTGKTMINDPKAMAEMIVDREWPQIDFRKSERAKKNDDNKIDSFLICVYISRIQNK